MSQKPCHGLLTKYQAAKILYIHHRTVHKFGNDGKLRSVEVPRTGRGHNTIRMYPIEDVERLAGELWGPIAVPDNWGHWFAGLVDGEGSFTIYCRPSSRVDTPVFRMTLRDDDGQALYDIRDTLGIGKVFFHKGRDIHANDKIYRSKPTLSFQTTNLHDAYKLATIFDRYPLRTKKQRDYVIWRKAIVECMVPFRDRDIDKLKSLAKQLIYVKKYRAIDPIQESL